VNDELLVLEKFSFVIPISVRFSDVDGMGHVNNAVYATYFEIGRTVWFERVLGRRSMEEVDFILARLEIDFLAPVNLEDEVLLGLKVSTIGKTSWGFEYLLTKNGGAAARGKSVQVFFDYGKGIKKPIPEGFEEAIEKLGLGGSSRPHL